MTARPTDDPTWATDATYAVDAGPDEGLANKVAASAGKREQGLRRGEPALAPEDNYWRNLVGKFIQYFDTPGQDPTADYPVASGAQARIQRAPWQPQTTAGAGDGWWPNDTTATFGGVAPSGAVQFDVSSTFLVQKTLDMPHGSVLTQLTVNLIGAGGHSTFPISGWTPPSIQLYKKNTTTGVFAQIVGTPNPTIDTSASAAAYQAIHPITMTGLSETVDNSAYEYSIAVLGEQGTGAQAGLIAVSVQTQTTVTKLDKAAS